MKPHNISNVYYDLEQEIYNCSDLTLHLDFLLEEILESGSDSEMTKDEISNIILGLSQFYSRKFGKLSRAFEAVFADMVQKSIQMDNLIEELNNERAKRKESANRKTKQDSGNDGKSV